MYRVNSAHDDNRYSALIESPTWMLIILVYGSWFLLVQNYHLIGPIIAAPLLVIVCTLFGSLCHELIHGHPTRITILNTLLGSIPLTLFLPYPIYRESHIQHHCDENITMPGIDPESYYCSASDYRLKSKLGKVFAWVNMTIAGRLLFSPVIEIFKLITLAFKAVKTADTSALKIWGIHLVSMVLLLLLITLYFDILLWQYLLIAYFAGSLTRIRSFYEHRARAKITERTVLMEPCWFFRILFLNLNYHLAHHENPSLPWYQLGDFYQAHKVELISRSGGFYYNGYHHWLLGHLIRPIDSPVHPYDEFKGWD